MSTKKQHKESLLRSHRDKQKLVGVKVPLSVHNYMSLFSVANDSSKSEILSDLINHWVSENKQDNTENHMLLSIAKRLDNQWAILRTENRKLTVVEFKDRIKFELSRKGMCEYHINNIIGKLSI